MELDGKDLPAFCPHPSMTLVEPASARVPRPRRHRRGQVPVLRHPLPAQARLAHPPALTARAQPAPASARHESLPTAPRRCRHADASTSAEAGDFPTPPGVTTQSRTHDKSALPARRRRRHSRGIESCSSPRTWRSTAFPALAADRAFDDHRSGAGATPARPAAPLRRLRPHRRAGRPGGRRRSSGRCRSRTRCSNRTSRLDRIAPAAPPGPVAQDPRCEGLRLRIHPPGQQTAAIAPWLARMPNRIGFGSSTFLGMINRPARERTAAAGKSIAERFVAMAFDARRKPAPRHPDAAAGRAAGDDRSARAPA